MDRTVAPMGAGITADSIEARRNWWPVALVSALTLAALGLRLVRLDEISLWYDEAFGLLIARRPWGEMNATLALDVHPPLWFWLIHLWGADSILWARLSGVLLGTASVPLLWALLRRPLGEATALTAALLLTVHPVHLFYSQELRMYALLGVLEVAIIANALRMMREGTGPRGWVIQALLGWALLMTHFLTGTVLAGLWLGMLACGRWRHEPSWLVGWSLSGVVALAGTLPWLLRRVAWDMVARRGEGIQQWEELFVHLLDGTQGLVRMPPWAWLGLQTMPLLKILLDAAWGAALVLLALAGGVRLIRDPNRCAVGWTLLGAFLSGLGLLVLYQAAGFLFFTRHYAVTLVPLVILVGAALSPVRRWRAPVLALLVATLLSHSAATLRMNGAIRDVTAPVMRYFQAWGLDRLPPLLCRRMFLALPLRAQLPADVDLRCLEDEETTPAQRAILGQRGLVGECPSAWRGETLWFVISGWGGPAPSPGDFEHRAVEMAEAVALGEVTVALRHRLAIAGGRKWVGIVEVTPERVGD